MHRQVELIDQNGRLIEVDSGIAADIKVCHKLGWTTLASCEGGGTQDVPDNHRYILIQEKTSQKTFGWVRSIYKNLNNGTTLLSSEEGRSLGVWQLVAAF